MLNNLQVNALGSSCITLRKNKIHVQEVLLIYKTIEVYKQVLNYSLLWFYDSAARAWLMK